MIRALFAALLLLSAQGARAEAMRIEIIELRHGFAEELLPQVEALLSEGGTVRAWDNKLVIKTTDSNLEAIRGVIEQLDRAPSQLLITVRYHDRAISDETRQRARVTVDDHGANVRLRSGQYSTRERSGGDQQLRVIAGQSAWINAGLEQQSFEPHPYGGVQPVIRRTGTGFSVTPRINGERVTLEINPERSRPSRRGDGSIETSQLSTTVSGTLGEWISLGGASLRSSSEGSLHSRARELREQNVSLKVERID